MCSTTPPPQSKRSVWLDDGATYYAGRLQLVREQVSHNDEKDSDRLDKTGPRQEGVGMPEQQ